MANFIYGFHSIIACLWQQPENIELLYLDNKRKDKRWHQLLALANQLNLQVEFTPSSTLTSLTNQTNHQGVVAKLKVGLTHALTLKQILDKLAQKNNALLLILDGITDCHNLGAIIRTAECFGVDAIILPKDNSANPENSLVIKASSGAIHFLPVITVTNISRTLEQLKEQGFWIAGTSLSNKSTSLFEFKPSGRLAWVMGSEERGIRRLVVENCDYLITIPLMGHTQSLNVSVACGIVLAHTQFMQHKLS